MRVSNPAGNPAVVLKGDEGGMGGTDPLAKKPEDNSLVNTYLRGREHRGRE